MSKDELVKCKFCNQTENIIERETPVIISYGQEDSIIIDGVLVPIEKKCRFFCTNCKKDF